MKWLKLFEEYNDDRRIELANNIFLTPYITKELDAMELNRVEDYRYIYYYTGNEGKEKLEFFFHKNAHQITRILTTTSIPRNLCDKYSSSGYPDRYILKLFLKQFRDFLFRKKYITDDSSSIGYVLDSEIAFVSALKNAIKEKSGHYSIFNQIP